MKIGKTGNMSIFFCCSRGRSGEMRYLVDDEWRMGVICGNDEDMHS